MKILRIIARLNVGGPAKHVVWLTDGMRERGHQSTLIAGTVPEGEEDMGYFAAIHGVQPVYLREMSRELTPMDIAALWKLFRIIRRERPDIVHTHTAKAGTIGRTAAFLYRWMTWTTLIGKPRRLRIVHTFHGHVLHGYYGPYKSSLFIMIERLLARTTDKIVVISQQQLEELNGRYSIASRDRFEVVPLGLDLSEFSDETAHYNLRRELQVADDTLLLGFIGRLTEIKDIPLLLNGFARCIKAEVTPRMKLVIVGDGHLRADLEGLVQRLGIAQDVFFLGNRENVSAMMSNIDIVVLTSKNEGTPLSLIEAMAAAKPIIAMPVGGVVDLLGMAVDEHTGFEVRDRGIAVTSREPADLARALIYAAQNERLRERLSFAGREFVQNNYSIDRLEEDIARLYSDLLDETVASTT
jgi:glycosyltransferase involved in cell wall biosynthesis